MITFACPGCQATFKLPDEMAGKTARCSKCNHRFTVPGGKPKAPIPASPPAPLAAPPASSAPPPPKKLAVNPVMEVLEAEVIDEPAAPGPPPLRAAKTPVVIDEVEVVDDAAIQESRPARKQVPVPAARDDEDDRRRNDGWDDEDEDRPRRRRRRPQSGSKLGVILASVGGGAFVLMFISCLGMGMTAAPRAVVVVKNEPAPFQPFNPPIQNPVPFDPNPNPMPANPAPVVDGGQINLVNGVFEAQSQLTANDPMDPVRRGSRAKRYTVPLQAGKTYVIDMVSLNPPKPPIFDPYLRVEQNGVSLAEDDDGGDNLNSRIVFQPQQTGTYVIVATTLIPRLGNFRLSVRQQ
jgi:predicted Zn finger-like uncharacterized protein